MCRHTLSRDLFVYTVGNVFYRIRNIQSVSHLLQKCVEDIFENLWHSDEGDYVFETCFEKTSFKVRIIVVIPSHTTDESLSTVCTICLFNIHTAEGFGM